MSVKMIADTLKVTSSSIKNHIGRLSMLKVVEIDHTEVIKGILSTYYKRSEATISLNSVAKGERQVVAQNLLKQVEDGFFQKERELKDGEGHFNADQLTGVIHLKEEDADQLYTMIRDFISKHEVKEEESSPYVYSIVAYREE
jgi:hypothetical protein